MHVYSILVVMQLKKLENVTQQAAELACATQLTNASRSLETPFGRLTCVI